MNYDKDLVVILAPTLSDGAELNPYGTEAVYELAIEPGAGRPMNIVSAAPSGLPVDFYWERLKQEEDYFFQSSLVDAHDPWLLPMARSGRMSSPLTAA